jgi:predicted RNase H-like nuclease (RuvC/YqgF family)
MLSNSQTSTGGPGRPLHQAREKTGRIQRQLAVAGAELELTNAVLDHNIPEGVKRLREVQRALTQNSVIEGKVQQAADELQVVTELLEEESAERERLERELARRPLS